MKIPLENKMGWQKLLLLEIPCPWNHNTVVLITNQKMNKKLVAFALATISAEALYLNLRADGPNWVETDDVTTNW